MSLLVASCHLCGVNSATFCNVSEMTEVYKSSRITLKNTQTGYYQFIFLEVFKVKVIIAPLRMLYIFYITAN